MDSTNFMGMLVVGLGGLGTTLVAFFKIKGMIEKNIEDKMANSLALAKSSAELQLAKLKADMTAVKKDIQVLEAKVFANLGNMNENYHKEIKNLYQKIEEISRISKDQNDLIMDILAKSLTSWRHDKH